MLLSIIATTWASDTGAYACGLTLGRHKLLPAVSPKKSVEGAVGGLLFAAVVMSVCFAPLLKLSRPTALLLGAVISLAGQCGDLAESALKRWGNTKDSGRFLPGHGGVLDRLDSLLFAVPVGYFLLSLAVRGGI
ncbi:MAG: phosphatidate cytidylyltransferase [Dethiobacteraceae bacterium]